jgi:hypothetical protein
MGVDHLQGKRTGRPPGAKSRSAVKRDMMRAYRYLRKPDSRPLPPGPAWWLELARTQPEKFMEYLLAMETMGAEKPRATTEPNQLGGPRDDMEKDNSGQCQVTLQTPMATTEQQNGNGPARHPVPPPVPTQQTNDNGAARKSPAAKRPPNVKKVSMPEKFVLLQLRRFRASIPSDCKLVDCAVDPTRPGIVYSISSREFAPVAEGQPVPELAPRFSSAPR